MKTTLTLNYTASCDRVAAMLVDPEFAAYVGEAAHATSTEVTPIDHGLTTVMTMDTPDSARMFLGKKMHLTQTITCEDPSPDRSRKGQMSLTMSGAPISLAGPILLHPAPEGSTIVYDMEFHIRIPLVGKKLEGKVEGYLEQIIQGCEEFGNQWLDQHQG